MADQSVNIVFSAADQNLLAMWDKMRREGPEKTLESLKALKGKAVETDQTFKGMAGEIVKGLGAAQLAQKALNAVIQEGVDKYRQMIENGRNAASFQVTAAGAQRAALRNLNVSEMSPATLAKTISSIGTGTGADITSLYQAASGVLSAKGKTSAVDALDQLAAVAKMDPSFAAAEMQSMAGASLDIRKAFGGNAKQALGAMLAAQQTARVENTGQFAQNVVPALAGLKGFGGDFRSSSAIVAAISQESADVEGARSGTAAIQLAKEVQQRTAAVKSLIGKGTAERLDWLMTPEGATIRQQMVGNLDLAAGRAGRNKAGELTGEAKQYMAMIGLMTPGSSARQAYEAAFAATPTIETAGNIYDANIEAQRELGFQKTMRTTEGFQGARQMFQSGSRRGMIGATRKGLEETLNELNGVGWNMPFQQRLELFGFDAKASKGGDPRILAADILEHRGVVASGAKDRETFQSMDVSGSEILANLKELIKTLRAQAEKDPINKVEIAGIGEPRQEQRATPSEPPVGPLKGGD